jgi:DNA-binding Xre family transcriptional regulator
VGTKLSNYVKEMEAGLSQDGLAALEAFRERYDLAGQLLALRTAKKLTQTALAKQTGIPESEISRIEHGSNTTVATLRVLAEGLGARLALVPDHESARELHSA